MGLVKHAMEHHEHMREVAIGIAVQAGVLQKCMVHEDIVFEGGNDIEGAYKLANWRFTRGLLADTFPTRKIMTDCIKGVVEEHAGTECGCCAKVMDED
jgi:hypothetical protein